MQQPQELIKGEQWPAQRGRRGLQQQSTVSGVSHAESWMLSWGVGMVS